MGDRGVYEVRISCEDCEFVAEFERDGDKHPADEMNRHKRETGHELSKERLD